MARKDDLPDSQIFNGKVSEGYQSSPRKNTATPMQPLQTAPVQAQPVAQTTPAYANPVQTEPVPQGNYQAYSAPTTNPYYAQAIGLQTNANNLTQQGYQAQIAAAQQAMAAQQNNYQRMLSDYENRVAIQKQAAEASRQAALQQALLGYGAQQDTVRQDADAAARQAYISRMLAQRDIGQQLDAMGYTGGLNESSRLKLLTNYEANRGNIITQRDRDLAALDLAMRNAEYQTAADIAQQNANYDLQGLQSVGDLYTAMMNAEISGNNNIANLQAAALNAQANGDNALASLYMKMAQEGLKASSGGSGGGSGSGGSSSKNEKKYTSEELSRMGNELVLLGPFNSDADAWKYIISNADGEERRYQIANQMLKSKVISNDMKTRLDRMIANGASSVVDDPYSIYGNEEFNPAGLVTVRKPETGKTKASELERALIKLRNSGAQTRDDQIRFLQTMEENGEITPEISEIIIVDYLGKDPKEGLLNAVR